MIMKKLIAFAVVLALASGGVFAADVSAGVIGTVKLVGGDSSKEWDSNNIYSNSANSFFDVTKAAEKSKKLTSGGGMNRLRFEASAEVEDGVFGGFLRSESGGWAGLVYWKPIDMLKMTIGVNPDGHWGKDGGAGWGFYQTASDTGVTNPNSVWYGPGFYYGMGMKYRDAFYGGWGNEGLMLEIKPVDMIGINIGIPFIKFAGKTIDVFKQVHAQIDVNLDFGNIALTYQGDMNGLAKTAFPTFNAAPTYDTEGATPTYELISLGDAFYDPRLAPMGAGYQIPFNSFSNIGLDDNSNTYDRGGYAWNTERAFKTGTLDASPSTIFLSASIGAIENLSLDVGVGYSLPVKEKFYNGYNVDPYGEDTATKLTTTTTYQPPIAAGIAAKYGMGDFAIKVRVMAKFMGSVKTDVTRTSRLGVGPYYDTGYIDQDPLKYPFQLMGELMPFYAMSDTMRVYFALGMGFTGKSKYEYQTYYMTTGMVNPAIGKVTYKADAVVGWHINPYVEVGSEWGPKFLVGVKLWSDGKKVESPLYGATNKYVGDVRTQQKFFGAKKAIVNWEVPIAMMVSY
jgi:hypothetical protein